MFVNSDKIFKKIFCIFILTWPKPGVTLKANLKSVFFGKFKSRIDDWNIENYGVSINPAQLAFRDPTNPVPSSDFVPDNRRKPWPTTGYGRFYRMGRPF
jgi:hypothetical protein